MTMEEIRFRKKPRLADDGLEGEARGGKKRERPKGGLSIGERMEALGGQGAIKAERAGDHKKTDLVDPESNSERLKQQAAAFAVVYAAALKKELAGKDFRKSEIMEAASESAFCAATETLSVDFESEGNAFLDMVTAACSEAEKEAEEQLSKESAPASGAGAPEPPNNPGARALMAERVGEAVKKAGNPETSPKGVEIAEFKEGQMVWFIRKGWERMKEPFGILESGNITSIDESKQEVELNDNPGFRRHFSEIFTSQAEAVREIVTMKIGDGAGEMAEAKRPEFESRFREAVRSEFETEARRQPCLDDSDEGTRHIIKVLCRAFAAAARGLAEQNVPGLMYRNQAVEVEPWVFEVFRELVAEEIAKREEAKRPEREARGAAAEPKTVGFEGLEKGARVVVTAEDDQRHEGFFMGQREDGRFAFRPLGKEVNFFLNPDQVKAVEKVAAIRGRTEPAVKRESQPSAGAEGTAEGAGEKLLDILGANEHIRARLNKFELLDKKREAVLKSISRALLNEPFTRGRETAITKKQLDGIIDQALERSGVAAVLRGDKWSEKTEKGVSEVALKTQDGQPVPAARVSLLLRTSRPDLLEERMDEKEEAIRLQRIAETVGLFKNQEALDRHLEAVLADKFREALRDLVREEKAKMGGRELPPDEKRALLERLTAMATARVRAEYGLEAE